MKKQVHIQGRLLRKLEPGRPAMVKLEDNSMMRTSSVIRFVGDSNLVWFETQNTWYCLKFTEKRSLNKLPDKKEPTGPDLGLLGNPAVSCDVKAV